MIKNSKDDSRNPWINERSNMSNQEIEFFGQNGYLIKDKILDPHLCSILRNDIGKAIVQDQVRNGTKPFYKDYGMVLVSSLYSHALAKLPGHEKLMDPFNTLLGDGCILYAYTSSSMPPNDSNYSRRIHVDSPHFIPDYITNIGATILLDDFTEKNGATQYLPGSHLDRNRPTEEYFEENCETVLASAGSVFYFNARLWHRGGINKSQQWRHALTFNMCRSWMKQRLDIPRLMKTYDVDLDSLSRKTQQKLGCLSQVPQTFDEYYAPSDKRSFSQSHG